jgi:hypothetical protein
MEWFDPKDDCEQPLVQQQTIDFIKHVGGPLTETTEGCWVRLEHAPGFKPDTRYDWLESAGMLTLVLLSVLLGWMSHAAVMS